MKSSDDVTMEKNKDTGFIIKYFEDNWVNNTFIEFRNLKKHILLERTNNVSKIINSLFNKHFGLSKASVAVFFCKIRELECFYLADS